MTYWTPSPSLEVKVLGLAWRGRELLVSEVEDSKGRVKGLRPLGGRIEFGETREQALRREFGEELGCEVNLSGGWHAFENIYQHEGATGHEFVFAANITLADQSLYGQDRFRYLESDASDCWALWVDPSALPAGTDLYPDGLGQLIAAGIITPGG